MRNLTFLPAIILAFGFLFVPIQAEAQPARPAARSIAFFGRVEAVDSDRKIVTVKHGKIVGYMDTGTTEYSTDEDAVLKRLQPGDDIRATVYPNDLTLHRIQIVYRSSGAKGKPSK